MQPRSALALAQSPASETKRDARVQARPPSAQPAGQQEEQVKDSHWAGELSGISAP